MSAQSLALLQIARITFIRVWVVFSSMLVLVVTIWSGASRENPLLSDDPYIIGFLFAFIAASLAFIYSVADHFRRLVRRKHWIVATALVVWCLAFTVLDTLTEGEGDGWGYFIAVGSFVAGSLAWFVCTLRFPVWVSITISAIGLVFLFAYGYVVTKMNALS